MKNIDEKFMTQCISIAREGIRSAMPNPSVGAIIVHKNKIIGQGSTSPYGGAHAEVNAINSVIDKSLLNESTLYVTLEPCSHYGNTPPCSQAILHHKIANVIIGIKDPNTLVNGCGIEQLKNAGVNVKVNILKEECYALNKRFFVYHKYKRPYIILKWAQTKDGYFDKIRSEGEKGIFWISRPKSKELTHQWRAEEAAICVGTNTVLNDNPTLTVREATGINPLRIVIDRQLTLDKNANVFNLDSSTLIINEKLNLVKDNLEYIAIDFRYLNQELMRILYDRKILSVIIEGGKKTIESFLNLDLWDEARVIKGVKNLNLGVSAPNISIDPMESYSYGEDLINIYSNNSK